MKRNQTGEVMLAVMVVILAVMWLGGGHMGMMGMGNGGGHAGKSEHAAQQTETGTSSVPAPNESTEHQH